MTSRRVMRYQVSPEVFPMALETGLKLQVIRGIPKGAEFRGYAIDHQTNTLMIYVEHGSFDLIQEGFQVPIADPIRCERINECN